MQNLSTYSNVLTKTPMVGFHPESLEMKQFREKLQLEIAHQIQLIQLQIDQVIQSQKQAEQEFKALMQSEEARNEANAERIQLAQDKLATDKAEAIAYLEQLHAQKNELLEQLQNLDLNINFYLGELQKELVTLTSLRDELGNTNQSLEEHITAVQQAHQEQQILEENHTTAITHAIRTHLPAGLASFVEATGQQLTVENIADVVVEQFRQQQTRVPSSAPRQNYPNYPTYQTTLETDEDFAERGQNSETLQTMMAQQRATARANSIEDRLYEIILKSSFGSQSVNSNNIALVKRIFAPHLPTNHFRHELQTSYTNESMRTFIQIPKLQFVVASLHGRIKESETRYQQISFNLNGLQEQQAIKLQQFQNVVNMMGKYAPSFGGKRSLDQDDIANFVSPRFPSHRQGRFG